MLSPTDITDEFKAGIKNNYENALKFNSNTFFTNLLKDGQFVKGWPLVIIARPELLNEFDTSFPAAHKNIFATLLEMMKFPQAEIKYNYPLSLFEAKSKNNIAPRTYFIGDISGRKTYRISMFDK
ncbi:MAG TPA: hypothetical protein PKY82_34465 [Pyrinomonadaceae bacterium]|nr:hypothetical protein [Pyrinomonadaceae bacterium]